MSMKQRDREKFLARQAQQAEQRQALRRQLGRPRRKASRSEHASREEQNARYLDCGPLAWDDKT